MTKRTDTRTEQDQRTEAARRKCRELDPIEMVTIAARAELATYGTRQPVTLPTAPASVTM